MAVGTKSIDNFLSTVNTQCCLTLWVVELKNKFGQNKFQEIKKDTQWNNMNSCSCLVDF